MLIVTGTKRSGTSLWMQIIIAAGYPYIGKPYMANWEESIQKANPNGFYESPLRRGIFHATNPDSKTGDYLRPEDAKKHAVKVFIPGLIRTDIAYVDRVIATIRPWREYVYSVRRLFDIEDQHLSSLHPQKGDTITPLLRAELKRPLIHPALEWWRENFDLIRNYAIRNYSFNMVSFSKLLADPEQIIPPVITWCGGGDIEAATKVVNKKFRTQEQKEVTDIDLEAEIKDTFDELHEHFYEQRPLSGAFLNHLNRVDEKLRPMIDLQKESTLNIRLERLKELGLEPLAIHKATRQNQEDHTTH
jgi:hypothetical protein